MQYLLENAYAEMDELFRDKFPWNKRVGSAYMKMDTLLVVNSLCLVFFSCKHIAEN